MKKLLLAFGFSFPIIVLGQSGKIISLSLKGYDNYYYTTNSNSYLGRNLRNGEGFGLSLAVEDTSGKRGYVIDIVGYDVDNYYKNVLPNSQLLDVSDAFLMADYLFKILKFNEKSLSVEVNLGIGISTLIERDYWDEYDNDLGFNDTYLKDEARFGRNIGVMHVVEAEGKLRISKRLSLDGGLRYWGSATGQLTNSRKLTYVACTGSGFAFTLGFGLRL